MLQCGVVDLDPTRTGVVACTAPTVAFARKLGRGHWRRRAGALWRTDPVGRLRLAAKQDVPQLA